MDPKIWGRAWWQVLFSLGLGYSLEPNIDQQFAYYRFLMLLSDVLPCESCKINYVQHFKNVPLNFYLYSRKALLEWILMLHNEVNKTQGKPELTLDQAIMKYLGPEIIKTEQYRQSVDPPPRVLENRSVPAINNYISQRPQCVEGFGLQTWTLSPKDLLLLILLGLVVYLLWRNR